MTPKHLHNQRGAAMVIAMLTLILLTMLGMFFMTQTKVETQLSGYDQRATQALTNAEAGYAEVLARLNAAGDTVNYIGEPAGTLTPGWGRYLVLASGNSAQDPDVNQAATDGLDNDGDGLADEAGERYPEVLTRQGADAINYPWANVHYKLNGSNQLILFGDHDNNVMTPPRPNLVKGWPIVVITTFGEQTTAERTVEVEAVKVPFDMVAAAFYSEDDKVKFNGTQFLVSGQDWDPYAEAPIAGNPQVPGIVTTGRDDAIDGALDAGQANNVVGQGGTPSVSRSNADMDLQAMAQAYATLAKTVLPTGTYSNQAYGDLDHYTVVHCTGDMHVSGGLTGGGILVVDGDFDCSGSFTWYGLVLVMGDVKFTGGGNEVHVYGSVLTNGGGADQQTVSGNAKLYYSSMALNKLTQFQPYTVVNWREI
jgi:hypothetical protein